MRGIDTILFLRSFIIDAWCVGTMIGKSGVSYAHVFALRNGFPLGFPLGLMSLSMTLALCLGFVLTDWRGAMTRSGWGHLRTWLHSQRTGFRLPQRLAWKSERLLAARGFVLQLCRYMTVGGLTTLLDFLMLNALLVFLPTTQTFHINLYSTGTYVTSLVIGYAWHRWWTFRSSERPKAAFWRFIALNAVTFGVNTLTAMGLMSMLPGLLGIEMALAANLSKGFATLFSGTLNFLGQRGWVFHAKPAVEDAEVYYPADLAEHDA